MTHSLILEQQIADLTAERDHWKAIALGTDAGDPAVLAIRSRLRQTPARAWLLHEMLTCYPRTLTLGRIRAGMPGWTDPEERSDNLIAVHISRIRDSLPRRDMIVTVRATGYKLSEAGKDYLQQTVDG